MHARCSEKQPEFVKRRYFDRGIGVCDEWQEYLPFKAWALQNGWEKGLSLDRIDNSRGYSPDNCRFITQAENARRAEVTALRIESSRRNISLAHQVQRSATPEVKASWSTPAHKAASRANAAIARERKRLKALEQLTARPFNA